MREAPRMDTDAHTMGISGPIIPKKALKTSEICLQLLNNQIPHFPETGVATQDLSSSPGSPYDRLRGVVVKSSSSRGFRVEGLGFRV